MVANIPRRIRISIGLLAILLILLAVVPAMVLAEDDPPPGNATYIVKPGDTWNLVAQRLGISTAELIRANPQAVRRNGWLWVGDRLTVPTTPPPTTPLPAKGYWYRVKPGDTWNIVSRATGVPVRTLWQANPGLMNRLYWLYIGERVWIPAASPSGSAAGIGMPTPGASAPLTATVPITPTIPATPAVIAPATVVPATVVPATAAPATAVPATPRLRPSRLRLLRLRPSCLRLLRLRPSCVRPSRLRLPRRPHLAMRPQCRRRPRRSRLHPVLVLRRSQATRTRSWRM